MSSSSCARSVTDIGDYGLPILSDVSSPDELIVGRFVSDYEVIQTVYAFWALSPSAFGTTNLSTQYLLFCSIRSIYMPKNCSCLFLMVLSRDGLNTAISIDLGLTSFQSMIFSLFFRYTTFLLLQVFFLGLLSVSSIYIQAEGWTII